MIISGKLEKSLTLNNKLIILDGIWGGGKSLLFPLISSFKGVEDPVIDLVFEEIVRLWCSGRICDSDAKWLIQNHLDRNLYYKKIGRNINLKLIDETGLFGKKYILKTIYSLIAREDLQILDGLIEKNNAELIVTHMLNPCYQPLRVFLQDRLKFIEVVRHPLYVIKHISAYLNRWDCVRDFNMSKMDGDTKIPAFIEDVPLYKKCNIFEKSAIVLGIYYKDIFNCDTKSYDASRIFISFEDICFDPDRSMDEISSFLDRKPDINIESIYKKIAIPRVNLLGGIGKKKYGWSKSDKGISDHEYMISTIQELKYQMNQESLRDFFSLCEEYEDRFVSRISKLIRYE